MIVADENPVERLMDTVFGKINTLIDANTVIGTPITTVDGVSIIPISRVTLGLMTGGGEYSDMSKSHYTDYPFAGGSGVGVNICPIAFIVNNGSKVNLISIEEKGLFDTVVKQVLKAMEKSNDKKD